MLVDPLPATKFHCLSIVISIGIGLTTISLAVQPRADIAITVCPAKDAGADLAAYSYLAILCRIGSIV